VVTLDTVLHLLLFSWILHGVYVLTLRATEEKEIHKMLDEGLRAVSDKLQKDYKIDVGKREAAILNAAVFPSSDEFNRANAEVISKNLSVLAVATVFTTGLVAMLMRYCGSQYSIMRVCMNNFALISLVGVIEFCFVFKVALRYSAIRPSEIEDAVVQRLNDIGHSCPRSDTAKSSNDVWSEILGIGIPLPIALSVGLVTKNMSHNNSIESAHQFSLVKVLAQAVGVTVVVTTIFFTKATDVEKDVAVGTAVRTVDDITHRVLQVAEEAGQADSVRKRLRDFKPSIDRSKDESIMTNNAKARQNAVKLIIDVASMLAIGVVSHFAVCSVNDHKLKGNTLEDASWWTRKSMPIVVTSLFVIQSARILARDITSGESTSHIYGMSYRQGVTRACIEAVAVMITIFMLQAVVLIVRHKSSDKGSLRLPEMVFPRHLNTTGVVSETVLSSACSWIAEWNFLLNVVGRVRPISVSTVEQMFVRDISSTKAS